MLFRGNQMFLVLPSQTKERILHPGKVGECDLQTFVSEFEDSLNVSVGDEVIAYAELRGKFMQQGARIIEVRSSEPVSVMAFDRIGTPVSAESRELYRVCTVSSNMIGMVGKCDLGPVVDVSSAGFAMIAMGNYQIGSVVPVTVNFEGRTLSGTALVKTAKPRFDGKTRYGFLAVEHTARKELEKMSMTIQRTQLRRMAGAA